MDLADLYPLPVIARLDDFIVFELRPFDLRAVVWAESSFSQTAKGGLNIMNEVLGNPDNWQTYAATVADISFYLSKDLDDSGIFSACEFKSKINKAEDGPNKALARLHVALEQVFFNSFPQPEPEKTEGGAIYQGMVAKQKKKEPEAANWEKVYADFYRAGGISLDDFYSMTTKQIHVIYAEIITGKMGDLKNVAAMHGVKMTNGYSHKKPQNSKFSEDEVAKFEKAQEKMMQEYGNPS